MSRPSCFRLLKVKPEERLTIEGVLAHPWLNCTEALDNVLPSAQMMMDKVSKLCYVINEDVFFFFVQPSCIEHSTVHSQPLTFVSFCPRL